MVRTSPLGHSIPSKGNLSSAGWVITRHKEPAVTGHGTSCQDGASPRSKLSCHCSSLRSSSCWLLSQTNDEHRQTAGQAQHGSSSPALLLSSALLECFVWAIDPAGDMGGLPVPSQVSSQPPHSDTSGQSRGKMPARRERHERVRFLLQNKI